MNAAAAPEKRRARRIAADEAHSWARNLRLKNPYGKLLLCMISQYVQGDGTCFVGIKALAEDCELAEETIRRRLTWLEMVGAIVRLPQWIDENGRRNSENRGRRTTDEIRLLFEADMDVIEARAAGNLDADFENDTSSPVAVTLSHARGSTEAESADNRPSNTVAADIEKVGEDSISPLATPSLRTGPNDSNLNQKITPLTPLRGEDQGGLDSGSEAKSWPHLESWNKFEAAWREPILHQQLCRQIWSAFTDSERETAIKVARGYVNWRVAQKRPPNTCNAQKILREIDAWPRFVELAGPDPALRTFVAENSDVFAAVKVLASIGGWLPPLTRLDPQTGAVGYWRDRPPPADLIGLAVFKGAAPEDWQSLDVDSVPFKAWASRIHEWVGYWPKTLRVPCPFPPRKDGSIAPANASLMTQDDINQFGKTG